MSVAITPLYAGLLALVYVYLSARVITVRRQLQASLGDHGDKNFLKRLRVHANFAEYTPLALLLILMAEMMGTSFWLLHALGVSLIVGRLAHAYGVGSEPQSLKLRSLGMVLTFVVLVFAAVTDIVLTFLNGWRL